MEVTQSALTQDALKKSTGVIGGTRLGEEELRVELLQSLNSTGRKFKLAESRQTLIKNGQRRIFQTDPDKASVEHDFRFKLA